MTGAGLLGRDDECAALERLLADALAGQSRVAVLRGEAGFGKSALLAYAVEHAASFQIARAVGVESELELAYAGLHQLCAPMLGHLERLPVPQREALATVFALSAGPAPDRFLVGLSTLTLFSEVAEEQPLLCTVDDAHWLDHATAQVLGFVARRLLAERVMMICVARTGIGDHVLEGLPELPVLGLSERDARSLLLQNTPGPLDVAVCDQIVAESHGNPLALVELPRTWDADLAGGFGVPDSRPVAGKVVESYAQRLEQLPGDTRLLVLLAAADPLGDPVLLQRAAESLEVDLTAADPALDAGLLTIGGRVEFAHPLVRSAAYHSASVAERHRAHRALAEATDAESDPDRRAWHRARATHGPGEDVALELERSAGRAQARGGAAAAAAFLEKAVELTVEPGRKARRALVAAQAKHRVGAPDAARALLAVAESGPLDELQSARVELLHAQIAFSARQGTDAPPLLLRAAKRLEPLDPPLARETYLDALAAALLVGRLGGETTLVDVARAARAAPAPPTPSRAADLLLDGLALSVTDGLAAALPTLRLVAEVFRRDDLALDEGLRWLWLAGRVAAVLWDDEAWSELSVRNVQLARDSGALSALPVALRTRIFVHVGCGELAEAEALVDDVRSIADTTQTGLADYGAVVVAAWRGQEPEAVALIQSTLDDVVRRGEGFGGTVTKYAEAVLYNGLGRYDDAAEAAEEALRFDHYTPVRPLTELVEAATRSGRTDVAAAALEQIVKRTEAAGGDWALALQARARALLAEDEEADDLYREAVERFGRTRLRPDTARAHLLYGEWLRRRGRRVEAREQLLRAHDLLLAMGMRAFAERARRELVATGGTVRARTAAGRDQLTPQEEQIALLARDGFSNPEIGAQLFLSPRTVEWHLRKVFAKLDIGSRRELRRALPEPDAVLVSA
jgi:DNA-binding CsgD family transcriptional regulator